MQNNPTVKIIGQNNGLLVIPPSSGLTSDDLRFWEFDLVVVGGIVVGTTVVGAVAAGADGATVTLALPSIILLLGLGFPLH